jgi:tRNA uridine 5-carboxymethylaminomethyl modification enzyme
VDAEVARLGRVRDGAEVAATVLCRPGESYASVTARFGAAAAPLSSAEAERVEVLVRYAGYIERSRKELDARARYEGWSLEGVAFERVPSLSAEGRGVLDRARPATLGAAQRLRGVRDSDVTALLVHLKVRPDVPRETAV